MSHTTIEEVDEGNSVEFDSELETILRRKGQKPKEFLDVIFDFLARRTAFFQQTNVESQVSKLVKEIVGKAVPETASKGVRSGFFGKSAASEIKVENKVVSKQEGSTSCIDTTCFMQICVTKGLKSLVAAILFQLWIHNFGPRSSTACLCVSAAGNCCSSSPKTCCSQGGSRTVSYSCKRFGRSGPI